LSPKRLCEGVVAFYLLFPGHSDFSEKQPPRLSETRQTIDFRFAVVKQPGGA
jgi:hypothetical protein